MIQSVHWILTRRCNLKCYYCKITRNYKSSPYENIKYFFENEIKTEKVIECLDWFKEYNPNCFHLFYGGEPTLRDDLYTIIKHCNRNDIFFTVISNGIDKKRIKQLFSKIDYARGFTCSVDPILIKKLDVHCNSFDKSIMGLKTLIEYKSGIMDPVGEITVNKNTVKYLYALVEKLTLHNICSDITVIDNAKNEFYDFSNISDDNLLVNRNKEIEECFEKLINSKLNIHLPKILPMILNILPSNLDCQIQNNIRNLVIDADGSVRLCLRIRGTETPKKKFFDYINSNGIITEELINCIKSDKLNYCQKCNWTCPLMTMFCENSEINHIC